MTGSTIPLAVAGEQWRVIADFPNYEVSDLGRIRRRTDWRTKKAGELMRWHVGSTGYAMLILSHKGRRRMVKVHRLVLLAFVGPPPTERHIAAHNDGNPANSSDKSWGPGFESQRAQTFRGRSGLSKRTLRGQEGQNADFSAASIHGTRDGGGWPPPHCGRAAAARGEPPVCAL
jgi:hypothetical protein